MAACCLNLDFVTLKITANLAFDLWINLQSAEIPSQHLLWNLQAHTTEDHADANFSVPNSASDGPEVIELTSFFHEFTNRQVDNTKQGIIFVYTSIANCNMDMCFCDVWYKSFSAS